MAEKDDRPKATGCSMASCATIDDDKASLSSSQATCESGGCRRNMPFNTIPRITYHQTENAAPLRKPESGGAQSCPDPYDFITPYSKRHFLGPVQDFSTSASRHDWGRREPPVTPS
ncbi:hypothetical protein CIRG_08062 [Coccidioides immitis RMSCC 2394]|uniref:Uncharacterized protein n=1 Tax=Coccidioides immitis RMSCC 2394 TaxID=404692 RepID=A0A0J6YI74_COCIT|nr:hypothetical protein CIRG_08062 [Coccidioides immitis RMSCC 2394]